MQTDKSFKTSKKLIKIISLSDPKYRAVTFLIVLISLAIIPVQILEKMPNLSLCSKVLGEYCYSVGITRGVSSLLKGDLETSYAYNPLAPLVALVMMAIIVADIIKVRRGSTTFYIPKS